MKTAALIPILAAFLAAQQAGIEGVVLNQTSGQPLQGVHVRLYSGIALETATQAYGALTDARGMFSIAAMPPGNYVIEAERTGFLAVPGNGFMHQTEIALRPGQRITDYRVYMLPLVPVSGSVVNEAGEPVPGATVEATTKALSTGGKFDMAEVPVGTGPYAARHTDERGQFRLFLPAGAYYLASWLEPYARLGSVPGGDNLVNLLPNSATVTYYPESPDTSSATLLDVKPGAAITGLTIHAHKNPPPVALELNVVVTGAPAGVPAKVYYLNSAAPGQFASGGTAVPGAGGRFSIRNLRPGYVQLFAQCSSGDVQLQSELADVHLEPPGSAEVHLDLAPGGVLSGQLQVAGGGALATNGKLAVRLGPLGPDLFALPAATDLTAAPEPDGTFRIAGIPPGRYRVYVDPLPENAYMKTVVLNDTSAADQTLDFSRGLRGSPVLKLTISLKGAEITGEVRDADGGPVLNSEMSVSLVPEANQPSLTRVGAIVKDGRYTLKGVPPGRYRVYAADFLRTGNTAAARDASAAAADVVEVKEGDRITKDLKAVSQGVGR